MEARRYRVSWEMPDAWHPQGEYHPVNKEHTSLMEAVDQFLQLKHWEVTKEEPIRNVKLEEAVVEWKEKHVGDGFLKAYGVNPGVEGKTP